MDTTGFNLYTRRAYGRAPVGQRVNRIVGSQRGSNVALLLAFTPGVRVVHFECFDRGVNNNWATSFARTMSVILCNKLERVITDNAPGRRQLRNHCSARRLGRISVCFDGWGMAARLERRGIYKTSERTAAVPG